MTTRRTFLLKVVPAVGVAALLGSRAFAALPKLAENDKMAVTLGYKADSTKVDAKKYPKHTKDQACHSCTLYQGKPADASGPCTLFAGKEVSRNGWCMSWTKKA